MSHEFIISNYWKGRIMGKPMSRKEFNELLTTWLKKLNQHIESCQIGIAYHKKYPTSGSDGEIERLKSFIVELENDKKMLLDMQVRSYGL